MPVSFLSKREPAQSAGGPVQEQAKIPPMLAMMLKMPGVGESIQQIAALAGGIAQFQQGASNALIAILQKQDKIIEQNEQILNLLGYAAEPTAEVSAAAKIEEAANGE